MASNEWLSVSWRLISQFFVQIAHDSLEEKVSQLYGVTMFYFRR